MYATKQRSGRRVTFAWLVITAGVSGILSFALLAAAIGSDYWYIVTETNPLNQSDFEDMSSHSGLWRSNEGGEVYNFKPDYSLYSESQLHLLTMYNVIEVVLPLSLVLVVFGGICGLVSSMARSPTLLTGTASYFFFCSLLTLSGVTLYIVYSYQALAETERLLGAPVGLTGIRTSFGWSMILAWLSYGFEVLSGLLLLIAAHRVKQQTMPTIA